MTLSASTLALFVFLVPGFVFRFALFHGSVVKRPLGAAALTETLAAVVYAFLLHSTCYLILRLLHWLYWFAISDGETFTESLHQMIEKSASASHFFADYLPLIIIYLIAVSAFAAIISGPIQKYCAKLPTIAHLMYGPLATMLSPSSPYVVTCFVMTKQHFEGRAVMYAGLPKEVALRGGSNIDHIVLEYPEKFSYKIDRSGVPRSNFHSARSMGDGVLYISGPEIENVHFQGYTIEDVTPSLRSRISDWFKGRFF